MTKKPKSVKATKSKIVPSEKASKKDAVVKTGKRGRPRKVKTAETDVDEIKPKATRASKKNATAAKDNTKPKRRGRKPKEKPDSEVEIKVREIVKKTQAKSSKSEAKKESATFSLEDVRGILAKRKSDSKVPKAKRKKEEAKVESPVSAPKKSTKSVKVKKVQTASIDEILGFGSSAEPSRPIRDESKVPKEWQSYYSDLMSLRNSLKGALGQRSSETLGSSARESSGELSINSSDSGTETFNRDVALSMVASEQEALEEIEDAIDRIFDGSFGVCQETKKPIKKARLKVVPFTRFSLEGQTQYEQRNRKDRDMGGGIFATISDSTMGEDN